MRKCTLIAVGYISAFILGGQFNSLLETYEVWPGAIAGAFVFLIFATIFLMREGKGP